MVISRAAEANDRLQMTALIAAHDTGFSGGFGIAWALVAQVVGYVIQGVGLGKSVYDAVKGADQAVPAGEQASKEDISAIAGELQKQFPTVSKSTWENLITEGLGQKAAQPVTPAPCPEGYIRDPATGACMEVRKAGVMGAIPTWGWIALGGLGLLLLPKLGIMKIGR